MLQTLNYGKFVRKLCFIAKQILINHVKEDVHTLHKTVCWSWMLNCYWVAIIYHLFDDNCWWRQCFTDPTYQIDLLMGASGRHRGGIFQSKQNVSMSLHDMYPVCSMLQDIPALTIFWGCFLLTSFCIFIGKHPAYPHSNWSVFEVLFRVYYTLKVNFTENIEISGWWENPTGLNFNYSSYIYLNQCLIMRPTIFHNIQYNNNYI